MSGYREGSAGNTARDPRPRRAQATRPEPPDDTRWHQGTPRAVGPFEVTPESNDPELVAFLDRLLGDLPAGRRVENRESLVLRWWRRPDESAPIVAWFDGQRAGSNRNPQRLAATSTRKLNRARLDRETELAHLHAGAVTRDGVTVMILGASMSGKSTLTAHLVSEGWSYLSDEQLAVSTDGRIHPYQRPLTLRSESWPLFAHIPEVPTSNDTDLPRLDIPASAFGPVYHGPALMPDLIVAPDVSVAEATVQRLTTARTLEALIGDSLDLERADQVGRDGLLALAQVPSYRIAGQDLARTTEAIEALAVEGGGDAPRPPVSVPAGSGDSIRSTTAMAWLFGDGSSLIYDRVSGVVAVVDAAGFEAWRRADTLAVASDTTPEQLDFLRTLGKAGLLDGAGI